MFEDNDVTVNAGQEDVADSPVDEATETVEQQEDSTDTGTEGEQSAPATQKPDKPKQSADDDAKYAAARREEAAKRAQVEAELKAEREAKDLFAKQYGYQTWTEMQRAQAAKTYIDRGVDETIANELVSLKDELAQAKAEREQSKRTAEEQAKWNDLFAKYPETRKIDDFPAEVKADVENGETPLNAWRDYENKRLRAENDALKQNTTTKQKAVGSVKGQASQAGKPDPFLAGLNS